MLYFGSIMSRQLFNMWLLLFIVVLGGVGEVI